MNNSVEIVQLPKEQWKGAPVPLTYRNSSWFDLETQSCNTNAIGFYPHEGFEPIGSDTCCYTNNDIGKKEVRLNFGYFIRTETSSR